jgi:glycosyltransferase involved in cell wall biosynthesis
MLAQEDPRVVGLIAGDAMPGEDGYREELLRRIAEVGLGRRLRWLGHLESVEPFYHAIDVFVSTSEYESFGNSVCEAMACRRPVAAYRGGAVQEVVGTAGRIVEIRDLPFLATAVRELVADTRLREQLGEQARRRVAQEFNPVDSLRQLKAIYKSLLSER